jgi:hypothetical protein
MGWRPCETLADIRLRRENKIPNQVCSNDEWLIRIILNYTGCSPKSYFTVSFIEVSDVRLLTSITFKVTV